MSLPDMEQIEKFNSITKYPSIPTYHKLENGIPSQKLQVEFDEEVLVSEKVDGVNSRIVMFADYDHLIGSREEFLYAKDDRIINNIHGIVKTLIPVAEHISKCLLSKYRKVLINDLLTAPFCRPPQKEQTTIYFGEIYGGRCSKNSKQYTKSGSLGFRVFDIMKLPWEEQIELLLLVPEQIARWRDNGGQNFVSATELNSLCEFNNLNTTPAIKAPPPPTSVKDTYDWLHSLFPDKKTKCALDGEPGRPEGVVVRSADRKRIAKIRFKDYNRII